MKKKFYFGAVAASLLTIAGTITSCSSDNNDPQLPDEPQKAQSLYVIPAIVGDASYLITSETLDAGEISVEGKGTEVLSATYWVYKGLDNVFALVYNKGGAGTGASYYLDKNGNPTEKYSYTYNRITTYGTWGENVITASTGNSSQADEYGNYPQVLLFNYLNAKDGTQKESSILAEDFLGNGEKVHFAGIVEANNKLYTSVIPGGMSLYAIANMPEKVTDQSLITKEAGGSGSGAYTAGVIPSTQYPDHAYIAIYSSGSFDEKPIIAHTDKIGFACGRSRSQYYQTIWATNDGDLYVFSPGYGRTFLSTPELKKTTGTLPSGVVRIKAGATTFDEDYYVNIEELGNKNPIYRCWYIDEDYFLLQLYKNGAESMINDGTSADVSELAIFDAKNKSLKPVTGLPENISLGGEPYGEDGAVYIPINVTTGDYPAFYRVDAHTGEAVKGLTVKAESIKTVGKLNVQK
ncbi:MAG: DUF4374 domain-containing protein [Bacteroidaceae bacterium]|nr:DUF4374 domain-containing protein [Bacteroidaceae bacterium]